MLPLANQIADDRVCSDVAGIKESYGKIDTVRFQKV
jgi:hypothetical protein